MTTPNITLIKNENLLPGVFAALENAQSFLLASRSLYGEKEFQAAISLATISMEEALKGIELSTRFRRGQDMTSDDWNSLRSHKHKLTHVYEDAIRVLQEAGEKEEAEAMKKLEESGMRVPPVSKEKTNQAFAG